MEAKGLFNVARKEFIDHLTSRKFIIILALFLIISAIAVHQGIDDYNKNLEDYKEQISQTKEAEGPVGWMPKKPSILLVFQRMSRQMTMLGGILAIAMGFDLVSKEKETKSLKSLLSCPVFRDEIINGKAVGGILALVFAIGIALIISFAMLLIFSIVPDLDEFTRITLFGVVSILFLLSYFSIALMTSTVSRDSGRALIYALIILFALSFFMPTFEGLVAESVVGEPPEFPGVHRSIIIEAASASENESMEIVPVKEIPMEEEEWERYEEESMAYWEKRGAIHDAISVVVPNDNFYAVTEATLNPHFKGLRYGVYYGPPTTEGKEKSLREALEIVWKNILALLISPLVFFAIAYIKFMRMDIR
ncbi:MAG: ABC transporter permease subunit [Euryarchaeota archaeon]|nr:ABC transporter permease subunit [Euryarchaeota archaeon]